MKKFIPLILLAICFSLCSFAQPPTLDWSICIGGTNDEWSTNIFQVDSFMLPYISGQTVSLVGRTNSTDGTFSNCGSSTTEAICVTVDTNGNFLDCKSYGGSDWDEFNKGKYIFTPPNQINQVFLGRTASHDGDVVGNNGAFDAWFLRTNANGISILSSKCFGGSGWEDGFDFFSTSDGGFIFCGISSSDTIESIPTNNHGSWDGWIVKVDSFGNMLWNKMYGGSNEEFLYSAIQTFDGNYVFAGFTGSNDGDITENNGDHDYWIIKTDPLGNLLWQKTYGGSQDDDAYQVIETNDSGLIVVGYSYSHDSDVVGNHSNLGDNDTWILKLDSSGNLLWNKCYGGSGSEPARSICKASNNCFVIASYGSSLDGDVTGCGGFLDAWILKLDSAGSIIWHKCFGSNADNGCMAILKARDTESFYFVSLPSHNGGDVSCYQGGAEDIWLARIHDNSTGTDIIEEQENETQIYPNPVNSILTIKAANKITGFVKLFSNLGEVVENFSFNNKDIIFLNLVNRASGIYFLSVETGLTIYHSIIIKL